MPPEAFHAANLTGRDESSRIGGEGAVALGIVLPALVAVGALLLWVAIARPPNEDGAILYQFSRNLAEHGVIAYNLADGPAEGATDFLWMLALAGLYRLGIDAYVGANLLSLVAFAATIWLGWRGFPLRRPRALAAFVLGLVLAPMLAAAVGGFSVLVYGFAALAVAWLAVGGSAPAFYAAALATCLLRPDGCITVGIALACRLAWALRTARAGPAAALRPELGWVAGLALAGAAYFAWRATYFGEILPLPLIVKASCDSRVLIFCTGGYRGSFFYLGIGMLAFVAFLPAARGRRLAQGIALLLSLCVGPLLFYATANLQQNVGDRFFYLAWLAALSLVALRLEVVVERPAWWARGAALLLACTLPLLAWRGLAAWEDLPRAWRDNHIAVARGLQGIHPPGRLGVTEAGHLAYLSGWPAADLWGLNTRRYATRLAAPDIIKADRFDVLVAHADGQYDAYWRIPEYCGRRQTARSWQNMVSNIFAAVCEEGLDRFEVLVLPQAAPPAGLTANNWFQIWFLRRDFGGEAAVRDLLRAHGAMSLEEFRVLWQRLAAERG